LPRRLKAKSSPSRSRGKKAGREAVTRRLSIKTLLGAVMVMFSTGIAALVHIFVLNRPIHEPPKFGHAKPTVPLDPAASIVALACIAVGILLLYWGIGERGGMK